MTTRGTIPFVGVVIGKHYDDADDAIALPIHDPERPSFWIEDDWCGAFVAAFPREAAASLRCDTFPLDGSIACEPDALAEYFDHAASDAREAWNAYRETCKANNGYDPGEGRTLLVTGCCRVAEQS